MSDALPLWVVYDHPTDYPQHIVVRRWEVRSGLKLRPDQGAPLKFDDLIAARDHLRGLGLCCLGRDPHDDPKIIEVWF